MFLKLLNFIFFIISFSIFCNFAYSEQDYFEGKEANLIIKSGTIQETIKEEDHKQIVVEYDNNVFWCTVENNGNKVCIIY